MDWGFEIGLGTITFAVIAVIVFFGRKFSRAAERHASHIDLPLYVTPAGSRLFAGLVAFWVFCAAIRALAPGSRFGMFLNSPEGVFAVVSGSIMFGGLASAILSHFGFPIARKDKDP